MIDLLDQDNQKDRLSHVMHSTLTADTLVEENKVSEKKRLYNPKRVGKIERRKKKEALQRFVKRIYPKKRRSIKRGGGSSKLSVKTIANGGLGGMISEHSIRTHHELVFESYLKLLGMPYLINQIFCFNCSNFYMYGDQVAIPKKCQVCRSFFHHSFANSAREQPLMTTATPGVDNKEEKLPQRISHMSRPDFIIDYNDEKKRAQYKHDCIHHKVAEIKTYQKEYLKKVAIIRIDGSIHQKQSQMIKDYHQWMNYCERGVKVFIVQNEDITELLNEKDNGKSLLAHIHEIGNAVVDPVQYKKYAKSSEFKARVRKPF